MHTSYSLTEAEKAEIVRRAKLYYDNRPKKIACEMNVSTRYIRMLFQRAVYEMKGEP